MADKDLKISITTVANMAGADNAATALERIEAKARAAGAAVDASRMAAEREGPLTELQKLEYELQKITAEAKVLDAALAKVQGQGGKAPLLARQVEQKDTAAEMLMAEIEAMRGLEKQAEKTAEPLKKVHEAMPKIGAGGKNAGQAMLQLGYAMQDAQYGMRGVINNIPGLLMNMGGGAGLAGVVTLAAVAVSALAPAFTAMLNAADSKRIDEIKKSLDEMRMHMEKVRAALETADLKKWIDSLDVEEAAISRVNKQLDLNISLLRAQRRAKLEVESAQAALDMEKIDSSDMSEADKIRARASVQEKLETLQSNSRKSDAAEKAYLSQQRAAEKNEKAIRTEDDFKALKNEERYIQGQVDFLTKKKSLADAAKAALDPKSDTSLQSRLDYLDVRFEDPNYQMSQMETDERKSLKKQLVQAKKEADAYTNVDSEMLKSLRGDDPLKPGGELSTVKNAAEEKFNSAKADREAARIAQDEADLEYKKAKLEQAAADAVLDRNREARGLKTARTSTKAEEDAVAKADAEKRKADAEAKRTAEHEAKQHLGMDEDALNDKAKSYAERIDSWKKPNNESGRVAAVVAKGLRDGTNEREINSLAAMVKEHSGKMNSAVVSMLQSMIADMREQAKEIEIIRRNMKNK